MLLTIDANVNVERKGASLIFVCLLYDNCPLIDNVLHCRPQYSIMELAMIVHTSTLKYRHVSVDRVTRWVKMHATVVFFFIFFYFYFQILSLLMCGFVNRKSKHNNKIRPIVTHFKCASRGCEDKHSCSFCFLGQITQFIKLKLMCTKNEPLFACYKHAD